jgi:hypothetical protein
MEIHPFNQPCAPTQLRAKAEWEGCFSYGSPNTVISIVVRPTIFFTQTRYGGLHGKFRSESGPETPVFLARFSLISGSTKDTSQTGASSSQNPPSSASNVFSRTQISGGIPARHENQIERQPKVLCN